MTATDAPPRTVTIDTPDARLSTAKYGRRFGLLAILAAIIFGGASFLVLMDLTPIAPSRQLVTGIIVVNALIVASLCALVGWEIWGLMQARKKGRAAARLHIRIIGLFGFVAALPAILVAIVAGITLDIGLDRFFEVRTRTIVESSIKVAESYLDESTRDLQVQTMVMAATLDQARSLYSLDRSGFIDLLTRQARGRGLIGASVIRSDGSVLVRASIPVEQPLPDVPDEATKAAAEGDPVLIPPGGTTNLAGSVIKLQQIAGAYLYTIRLVDPTVMNSLRLMEANTQEYQQLERNRPTLQIAFALLYVGICLIVLLSAIWMGIGVADRLVAPIRRLIAAADEVRAGNLNIAVPVTRSEGDLRSLADTFNKMTGELASQRDEILSTQEQIDERRRFTEAVLSGVSAGVIGVSPNERISIVNISAEQIIEGLSDQAIGEKLEDEVPELTDLLRSAVKSGRGEHRGQISLVRGGRERTLNVQVTVEESDDLRHSCVITLDDITDLVTAQRSSAWADVARRIAHEIKNPLTPIQLSAERIKRRYGKVITEDREVFDQCTETIVRQVADIGRMVDEFSSFARMPKPAMQEGDLSEAIKEAVFLQQVAHPEIEFINNLDDTPLIGKFDPRLLSQALTNVVKNAVEAIEAVPSAELDKGRVEVRAKKSTRRITIDIIDNGKGLPEENRRRLLEPYMTTREKGTGLGLAIVGKILEEHGGHIELLDAPEVAKGGRGAMMRLVLPVAKAPKTRAPAEAGAEEN
ncbi:MAG: PAS domain-containing sensor histidine kinase [Pseudomonadota bacterium]